MITTRTWLNTTDYCRICKNSSLWNCNAMMNSSCLFTNTARRVYKKAVLNLAFGCQNLINDVCLFDPLISSIHSVPTTARMEYWFNPAPNGICSLIADWVHQVSARGLARLHRVSTSRHQLSANIHKSVVYRSLLLSINLVVHVQQ